MDNVRLNVRLVVSAALFLAVVLFGLAGPWAYPVDPVSRVGGKLQTPSWEHPLGTDVQGRDVLAQLIHGTGTSLLIGVTASVIAVAIAIVVGVISGYRAGLMDDSLMASANVVLAFPVILLLLVAAVFVPVRSPMVVALLIGFTSWPGLARAIRSQIMSLKEREFVFLSRMAGCSGVRIAFVDLLPNMMTYVFTSSVVIMSAAMLAEAGLSMIGVGVTRGTSLGTMLFWAQLSDAVRRGLFWWFIPPGGVLTVACASLLLLATALDQLFNPRLKER